MSNYEVELKSLLGNKERADNLKSKIKDKGAVFSNKNNQLNHYFNFDASNCESLKNNLLKYINESKKDLFFKILGEGYKISVRTREVDGKIIFVMKASVGDDTSDNGVKRIEFECNMPMTLNELDQLLLVSGLSYQAKWSREREEYKIGDINICLDKNAGYGYLAEFEKVVSDDKDLEDAKNELVAMMKEVGVEELSQDRLERMFDYYNKNWNDYYGTDKVFNIE